METWFVEEKCGDGSPDMKSKEKLSREEAARSHFLLADESVPGEDKPVGIDETEPAEESEEDRASKPILGEERQRSEPVLDICSRSSRHCDQISEKMTRYSLLYGINKLC